MSDSSDDSDLKSLHLTETHVNDLKKYFSKNTTFLDVGTVESNALTVLYPVSITSLQEANLCVDRT